MDTIWRTIIWGQLGATIDMLDNAIRACPDDLWSDPAKPPAWDDRGVVGFWYLVYHTLFFLDLDLSDSPDGFAPPAPFTLDELDPAGLLPDRPYRKDELQTYLDHCRKKCRTTIDGMTDEKARQRCGRESLAISNAELLLYTMRHVQHHTAQLNLMLRQSVGSAPRWVARAKDSL